MRGSQTQSVVALQELCRESWLVLVRFCAPLPGGFGTEPVELLTDPVSGMSAVGCLPYDSSVP